MSMLISNPLAFAADCIHSGDYRGAEQACRELLDRDPAVGEAWFVLGVASQLLGKVAQSVTYYRNSVRLAPGNPEAWNNLGASLSALRRSEEAEPCLRRALELEPAYAQAHNNLGNALQAQGRFAEALDAYHPRSTSSQTMPRSTITSAWSCNARDGSPRPLTGSPRPWSRLPKWARST